jgi:hypothetical protein
MKRAGGGARGVGPEFKPQYQINKCQSELKTKPCYTKYDLLIVNIAAKIVGISESLSL